jgi:hypothetical protein
MKKLFIIIGCIQIGLTTMAQELAGRYQLTGIHEMAAGFQLNADSSFRFFYSYGAVDREAGGTWHREGDTIRLQAYKVPGNDFEILKKSTQPGNINIHIKDGNSYLAQTVRCMVVTSKASYWVQAAATASISIAEQQPCQLYLQHQLYPDVVSLLKDTADANNYFEVALLPSLQQVSFKGIVLIIQNDTLHMPANYLIDHPNIRFVKQQ